MLIHFLVFLILMSCPASLRKATPESKLTVDVPMEELDIKDWDIEEVTEVSVSLRIVLRDHITSL